MENPSRRLITIVFIIGAYDPAKFALQAADFRVVRKPFAAHEIVDAINQSLVDD